jgi:hypothetical protein
MKFRVPKRYGQSKTNTCPFCTRLATAKNKDGQDVCSQHKKEVMPEIRCSCGSWLELLSGKFGPYFNCLNCGNVNYQKGMEMKSLPVNKDRVKAQEKKVTVIKDKSPMRKKKSTYPSNYELEQENKKETVVTSRDMEYFS